MAKFSYIRFEDFQVVLKFSISTLAIFGGFLADLTPWSYQNLATSYRVIQSLIIIVSVFLDLVIPNPDHC